MALFECTNFTNERKLYIDFVHRNRPNIIKHNNSIYYGSVLGPH